MSFNFFFLCIQFHSLYVCIFFQLLFFFYRCFVGIERDAVNIFTKYISPDAARPIPISEQIRNDIVGKRIPYRNDLSV